MTTPVDRAHRSAAALPRRLPLGSRDLGVPDRGRRRTRTAAGVSIWDTFARTPGPRPERRDRRRRGRPLPPLPRRRRADARARALGVPFLDLLAAGAARRPRPGERARARLLPPPRRRGARGAGSSPTRRSSTGTSRRSSRTRAGGRRARPRTGSRSTRASSSTPSATAVDHWLTMNEPWCAAFLGYGLGRARPRPARRPGGGRGGAPPDARATGSRSRGSARRRPAAEITIVLNVEPHLPATDAPEDVAAARLADGMHNRLFLDPVLRGPLPGRRARPPGGAGRPRAHRGRRPRRRSRRRSTSSPSTSTGPTLIAARDGAGARRLVGLAGRRDDRGGPAGGRAHGDGLAGRSRGVREPAAPPGRRLRRTCRSS